MCRAPQTTTFDPPEKILLQKWIKAMLQKTPQTAILVMVAVMANVSNSCQFVRDYLQQAEKGIFT